jgi:hypothetical protein
MARQILVGADAHHAALELLKAGHLDSNPVALEDGSFEVSLKPQVSDDLHFAGVQKLLDDLKARNLAPAANPASYYKMVLVGQRCYEMAENEWLKKPSIFGRKPQDLAHVIIREQRRRVYGLQDRREPDYQKQFRDTLADIGKKIRSSSGGSSPDPGRSPGYGLRVPERRRDGAYLKS